MSTRPLNRLQFTVTVDTNKTRVGDIQREWDRIAKRLQRAALGGRKNLEVEVKPGISTIQ